MIVGYAFDAAFWIVAWVLYSVSGFGPDVPLWHFVAGAFAAQGVLFHTFTVIGRGLRNG